MTNLLPAHAEDTIGPYYPPSFLDADRHDLLAFAGSVLRPTGTPIVLQGRIMDVTGLQVAPVLVEFWQANAAGACRTPNAVDADLDPLFDGCARQYCVDGRFHLRTVMPGTPHGSDRRAPHITLTIFSDGISRLVTQVFFAGESANDDDPLLASLPADLRPRLIARRLDDVGGAVIYDLDIVMRGELETPFFDDQEGAA